MLNKNESLKISKKMALALAIVALASLSISAQPNMSAVTTGITGQTSNIKAIVNAVLGLITLGMLGMVVYQIYNKQDAKSWIMAFVGGLIMWIVGMTVIP